MVSKVGYTNKGI